MEIRVNVRAGMDSHFKTTIESFDKGAVRRRSNDGWDYILSNVTKVTADEVNKWQCVSKAVSDKPKEYKMSDLLRVMNDNNSVRGHKESHLYKLVSFHGPVITHCRLRKSRSGCVRVEEEKNYELGVEHIQNFLGQGTGNDFPLKDMSGQQPKEVKVIPYGGDEVIAFYF